MAYATGKTGIKRNIALARQLLSKAALEDDEGPEKCSVRWTREILGAMDKRQGIFRNDIASDGRTIYNGQWTRKSFASKK
jgi:hypothetical protein